MCYFSKEGESSEEREKLIALPTGSQQNQSSEPLVLSASWAYVFIFFSNPLLMIFLIAWGEML